MGKPFAPATLRRLPVAGLRSVGLSSKKAEYLLEIAERFESLGELSPRKRCEVVLKPRHESLSSHPASVDMIQRIRS